VAQVREDQVTTTPGAASPRGWPRFLLSVLLGVVALSVVGMHQLSLGHAFATPSTSFRHSHAVAEHADSADHHGVDRSTATPRSAVLSGAASIGDVMAAAGAAAGVADTDTTSGAMLTAATPISDPDGDPGVDSCPGCGEHSMALSACLLALTLLVLCWPLLLPRVRLLPPMLRLRLPLAVVLVVRRIPVL
jgi:hypothetical protein